MIVVFLADGCFSCFFIWFVGPNALSLSLSPTRSKVSYRCSSYEHRRKPEG